MNRQRNWKTTAAGVLAILGAAFTAGAAILDDDPTTEPNWALVLGLLGAGGAGLVAADAPKKPRPGA